MIVVQELPVSGTDGVACIAYCRRAHISRMDVAMGNGALFYFQNQIIPIINQMGRHTLYCIFHQTTFGIIFQIRSVAWRYDSG